VIEMAGVLRQCALNLAGLDIGVDGRHGELLVLTNVLCVYRHEV
jgi:hypothetical protein